MSDEFVTPPARKRLESERAKRYRKLAGIRDRDALQEALARDPSLWDKDTPIVVAAARFRALDEHRRAARRARIAEQAAPDPAPSHVWDPLELVLAREELGELREALSELDQRDLLVVWLHAAGHSDEEIVATWDAMKLEPPSPSTASVRTRRKRARDRLRARLDLA